MTVPLYLSIFDGLKCTLISPVYHVCWIARTRKGATLALDLSKRSFFRGFLAALSVQLVGRVIRCSTNKDVINNTT